MKIFRQFFNKTVTNFTNSFEISPDDVIHLSDDVTLKRHPLSVPS